MTAPVRIEAEAWSDLRFATLARLMGFADLDHALIKVGRLWSWQAEHYTPESPTYVVDKDTIESALGEGGAAAMVRSRLAIEEPGGFRIRGTKGRIEWLWQRRQASAKGGEARKRSAGHKDKPSGYPSGYPAEEPGHKPEESPLPLALPEELPPARPRAIPPSTEQTPYDHDDPHQRRVLAEKTYQRVSDARQALAEEFGLSRQLPFPKITPSTRPQPFRDLLERVGEEGADAPLVCNTIVESLIAEARKTKSIEWLSLKAFSSGAWNTARERVPGWRKARAGPGPLRLASTTDEPDLSGAPLIPPT